MRLPDAGRRAVLHDSRCACPRPAWFGSPQQTTFHAAAAGPARITLEPGQWGEPLDRMVLQQVKPGPSLVPQNPASTACCAGSSDTAELIRHCHSHWYGHRDATVPARRVRGIDHTYTGDNTAALDRGWSPPSRRLETDLDARPPIYADGAAQLLFGAGILTVTSVFVLQQGNMPRRQLGRPLLATCRVAADCAACCCPAVAERAIPTKSDQQATTC